MYAREGAKVFVGDLNPAGVQGVAERYPGAVVLQTMNVARRADWDAAVERTLREFGRLDVLVNNAGQSGP